MCGIAGVIGQEKDGQIRNMLQTQHHRGPDNTSIWTDGVASLGHNRLSIIDLSAAANQPMTSADGRYVIIYNGEVYNYIELRDIFLKDQTFTTHSDTEVVLAMYIKYGPNMLNKLIGMFAFAIWDTQEKNLFASRDRFGVKPFYYATFNNQFVFASEIKTLWAAGVPRQPKDAVWADFFYSGSYGNADETFWQQIEALPAGHYLHYQPGGAVKLQKWYQFENSILLQDSFKDDEAFTDAYLPLLKEAVSLRFRADVPVGINLSGGLDSSVLLAMVHQLFPESDKIKAYTFYCNNKDYDELPWVQQMIARTAKPLEATLLRAADVPALAQKMADAQDEPFGGIPTIAYSNIFKTAKEQGYKVLLDGQGIDEAWAGYDYYFKADAGLVQGTNQSPIKPDALNQDFIAIINNEQVTPVPQLFPDRLQNIQYRDIFFTKIPRALRFNDRASMLWSVELREPFLDHRLVEMAFAQPEHRKHKEGVTKFLLRKMATQWLGGNVAFAPKRPLQTPQREWLRHELKEWATFQIEWLAKQNPNGWFKPDIMMKYWQDYLHGQSDNSFYIWQWINAAMLLRPE
ncbi:MAG: asparagine synthase (glutamine-hydrolyzing) [Chitinophagaceae bacterium]